MKASKLRIDCKFIQQNIKLKGNFYLVLLLFLNKPNKVPQKSLIKTTTPFPHSIWFGQSHLNVSPTSFIWNDGRSHCEGKSEGGGKIRPKQRGQGLGRGLFSLGRFLRGCLLIMYFRWAFCTDLPRWQWGTMRGGEICRRLDQGCFQLFHPPGFLDFHFCISNTRVLCFMLLVCLTSKVCFKLDSFGNQWILQSKPNAPILKFSRNCHKTQTILNIKITVEMN